MFRHSRELGINAPALYTKAMPSQILHTLFGWDLLDALCSSPELGRLSAWNPARQGEPQDHWDRACQGAFAVGCQGPDIFYHSRRTRPLALEYGSLLHRRGYGTFCAHLLKMALPAPSQGLNALAAYALGFVSHATLDRSCHPYIIYKSADVQSRGEENSLYHPFLERILDVLMLRELRRKETADWDQRLLAESCENPPPGLKELIARAMISVFPEKTAKDEKLARRIDNAFADSARFYSLTDPAKTQAEFLDEPLSLRRRYLSVVYPLDLPGNIDFLNTKREPWHYPYRQQSVEPCADTRSFPEIYADAVKNAVEAILPCMAHYLETGVFPVEAAARSIGDGCLSIHDGEKKPCAPNLSSPLPLDAELERQCRIRAN